MFGWFSSREREIRQLNKDAGSIVAMTQQTYRAERQAEIASLVRSGLAHVNRTCGDDPACREHELDRAKARHREARRSLDQVSLTAHTLVIIYLRALHMGDACQQARESIDAFVANWEHATDDQGVLPG